MTLLSDTVERILRARVYDVARESPLEVAPRLSARLGQRVLWKREDLQPTFSFKVRGAYNRMNQLDADARARGVIAASAGNHAQGVALAALRLGVRAEIVMPRTTPEIKVDAVRELGAVVELIGDTYDEANARARDRARAESLTFIHPYDDAEVIAGQGTVAVELLRQHPDPIDAVFVPVGGGGLIAGIAAYVKFLRPEALVIGVEPNDAACLDAALRAGERVTLDHVGLFADGVAVRQIGAAPFEVARECVDAVVTVSTDEICAAILDVFEDTRAISEPAGALAVAGLKRWAADHPDPDARLVAVLSGANMNFHRLRHISERAELGELREAVLAITVPERPGSFRAFCEVIGDRAITEFNYRCAEGPDAQVFAGVQLSDGDRDKQALIERLRAHDYPVVDLSDNELAKIHARHMVGGRAGKLENEHVLRFEFPERPGALQRFLDRLGRGWNITLFHYRNHGAAVGRVLAGIQVRDEEHDQLQEFLRDLGYAYTDETDNAAYRLFLR